MATQRKILTVENLAQKLKDAKSVVLTDYQGLDVKQISNLRSLVKEAGGEFEVVKNTLLRRAAADAKAPLEDAVLTGPTAVLWSWEDEISPLKVMDKFAAENEFPKAKAGLLGDQVLSADKIRELAALPGQSELQTRLVGFLNAPIYGLVSNLQGNLRKLVYTLQAVSKK
jgi:large subunit ribosomal protein L10